jgi:hypothetical protein
MTFRLIALLAIAGFTTPCFGQVTLLGVGTLPGDMADLSGLKGNQNDGTPHNRLGGMGSAIDYTGKGNSYVLASDRGPKDGATDFACRFHHMDIIVSPNSNKVELKLTKTTLLRDEKDQPFVGLLSAIDKNQPELSMRLDPEGIRIGLGGTVFIADEYGPFIYEFSLAGKRLRSIKLPSKFLPECIAAKPEDELPPHNKAGRQPNRGMEGLAISPDGSTLIGIMQSPLIQDGGLDAMNKRVGINSRIVTIQLSTGKAKEYVYPLESGSNGISEIIAVDDQRLLVLERDSLGGLETKCKKVFLINMEGASDVSEVASLPSKQLPDDVKAVQKKLLIDLLQPTYGLAGANFPEKVEGLAFGPDLADGRKLLIITADNDFVATAPFRVFGFAIERSALK